MTYAAWVVWVTQKEMPKMPKLETVAIAHCTTPAQILEMLTPLAITSNQFLALKAQAVQFLPALFKVQQRTPKSIVTLTIARNGDEYVIKVNNRARVTLA